MDIKKASIPIARRLAQLADLDYHRRQQTQVECGWARRRAIEAAVEQARAVPVKQ